MKKTFRPCRNSEHGLFIEHLAARKYSWRTQRLASYCLDDFDAYLKKKNIRDHNQVKKQLVLDYLQQLRDRGLKEVSIEIFFRPVKLFFDYLEEKQQVFVNPAADIHIKVPNKIPSVLSEEVIRKLLNAPDLGKPKGVRDRAFMELAYNTGMRREELIRLDLTDINMQEASVRVLGKGQKERILPIGKSAIHWLNEYITKARVELLEESENKALWVKRGGGRINYECAQSLINLSKERAGITRKIGCHDFRRAFATHLLQHGAGPIDVQHLLGHASLHHLRNYL